MTETKQCCGKTSGSFSASLVFYSQGDQTEEEDGSFPQQNPVPHLTLQSWTQMDADWACSYMKSLRNKVNNIFLVKDYMLIYSLL